MLRDILSRVPEARLGLKTGLMYVSYSCATEQEGPWFVLRYLLPCSCQVPGIKIGFLKQEPELALATVGQNITTSVQHVKVGEHWACRAAQQPAG